MTSPGIDPETVRLVAQCLNHYATPGPREKVTEHKMCFDFSLQLLCETFLVPRRIQTAEHNTLLRVNCPLFLSNFNQTWIFWIDFRKILKCHTQREPSCSMRTERHQTYGNDEANSPFSQFCERTSNQSSQETISDEMYHNVNTLTHYAHVTS